MVFAQALINPTGPAGACVELARMRRIQLVISSYVLQEVRELPAKLPRRLGITFDRVELLIREIDDCSDSYAKITDVYQNPFDPEDSPYINLALAAGAKLITSRDRHLLWLVDPSKPEGQEFQRRFPDLLILKPEQLLQRIREAADGEG